MVELSNSRELLERKFEMIAASIEANQSGWDEVNHLINSVAAAQEAANSADPSSSQITYTKFLRSLGISSGDLEIDPNYIFLITPFSEGQRYIYYAVKEVCENLNLRCERGDEKFVDGDILPHIVRSIIKARVVISNVTGRNANVYYEMGIAHALGKPVILLTQSNNVLLFDVSMKRAIFFRKKEDLIQKLQIALRDMIEKPLSVN